MVEELAMTFSSRIVAAEDIYPVTLEYRLHKIETRAAGQEVVAVIYDGEQEVRRLYGKEYHQALERAKGWIDEKEEELAS